MSGAVAERCAAGTVLYTNGAARPLAPFSPGALLPGTRFTVVRLLGQGGMGEVYEVEHAELGRRFAVKVLHRRHLGRSDLAARMRAEARGAGRLRHPGLVEVFDLGVTEGGRPYFAMELLEGRDLCAELDRLGVIAVPAALSLVAQALAALAVAHAAGVVHRDLKLENLFLCADGALKVLDFGVAKLLGGGASLTDPDALVGTPRMMSPEQCAARPVDARADLYAMGLVLYELVAGRGPFDELRGQRDALRFAHCEREPPPPSRFAPQPIPPGVERLILRALAKAPEQRFQTAAEMEAAVRRALDEAASRRTVDEAASRRTVDDAPRLAAPRRAASLDPTEPEEAVLDDEEASRLRPGSRRLQAPLARATGSRAAAEAPARRRHLRTRLHAAVLPRRREGAGVLGVCALVLASAALGLSLSQRWPVKDACAAPVTALTYAASPAPVR